MATAAAAAASRIKAQAATPAIELMRFEIMLTYPLAILA